MKEFLLKYDAHAAGGLPTKKYSPPPAEVTVANTGFGYLISGVHRSVHQPEVQADQPEVQADQPKVQADQPATTG
jgi:hypothetical protein